jgi:hypothetical protein
MFRRSTILTEARQITLKPSVPSSTPNDVPAKGRLLLLPWGAALALSALLVAAGRRWPTPLLEQPWAQRHPEAPFWLALALVSLPPLLIALVLLLRLRHRDRGESTD